MVGEAYAYVQGESLKACAVFLPVSVISTRIMRLSDGWGSLRMYDCRSSESSKPVTVARLTMSRSAISLGGKGDSESARMLSTSPEADVRLNGWSRVPMRFSSRSAVKTRFMAHSVDLALESGYSTSKSDAI